MMFQPLVVWCIFFCSGIVAGYYCRLPPVLLCAAVAAVSCAAFCLRNKRQCAYLVFCLAALLGALDIAGARPIPSSSQAVKTVLGLKHKIEGLISDRLNPPFSNILSAMVLGERRMVPEDLRQAMMKAGTWHLMVVSGTHTAIVAAIVLLLLKAVRVGRNMRFISAIVLLIVYCLLTGASSSVVRATVMTSVYLLTYLFKRPPNFLNSLAMAALAILIFDPTQLFQVGFQLSFLSVFFIFWLYPGLKNIFPAGIWKSRYLCVPANCFCVSLSACIGTAPLLAHVFNTFSCISIIANIVAAPLAALVMAGGLVLIGFGALLPVCAGPAALSAEFFIFLFVKMNMAFAGLPWASIHVPRTRLFWVVFCYFITLFLSRLFPRKQ
ncbi:MAG TPA: hypothetical protein DCL35_01850 [Candidatus Omnitrophica bacterium]|nr:hypothetical protein [Candidatus Omnitrophota bacterium]